MFMCEAPSRKSTKLTQQTLKCIQKLKLPLKCNLKLSIWWLEAMVSNSIKWIEKCLLNIQYGNGNDLKHVCHAQQWKTLLLYISGQYYVFQSHPHISQNVLFFILARIRNSHELTQFCEGKFIGNFSEMVWLSGETCIELLIFNLVASCFECKTLN